MIVYGTCVGGTGEKYNTISEPTSEPRLRDGDQAWALPGTEGICRVYNGFIDRARSADAEALVLLHDDVEITSRDFRARVLKAVREPDVGIAGTVGGAGLSSLAWWDARRLRGRVQESRGLVSFRPAEADVDAVDGMLLVLSPRALETVRFDEGSFDARCWSDRYVNGSYRHRSWHTSWCYGYIGSRCWVRGVLGDPQFGDCDDVAVCRCSYSGNIGQGSFQP